MNIIGEKEIKVSSFTDETFFYIKNSEEKL